MNCKVRSFRFSLDTSLNGEPSTYQKTRHSVFISSIYLVIQQVFIKGLLGAGNTAVNKAEERSLPSWG